MAEYKRLTTRMTRRNGSWVYGVSANASLGAVIQRLGALEDIAEEAVGKQREREQNADN